MFRTNNHSQLRVASQRRWAVAAVASVVVLAGGYAAYGSWRHGNESDAWWAADVFASADRTTGTLVTDARIAIRSQRWTEAQLLIDRITRRSDSPVFQTFELAAEVASHAGTIEQRQQILDRVCRQAERLNAAAISTQPGAELSALRGLLNRSIEPSAGKDRVARRAAVVLTVCERVVGDSSESTDRWAVVAARAVASLRQHGVSEVGCGAYRTTTTQLAARADQLLWLAGIEQGVVYDGGSRQGAIPGATDNRPTNSF